MSVTLRRKDLTDEKERLYLDIYNPEGGSRKRQKEFLKLFLYKKPKTPLEKTHNKETLQLAEALKGQKQIDIQNGLSGFSSKKQLKGNFIDYFERLALERKKSAGNYGNWDSALKHLKKFFGDYFAFSAITEDQLESFKTYLIDKVSQNSASSYFAKVKAAVNQAFEERILNENPIKRMKGIKPELTNREFLTEDELRKLFHTDCEMPVLKRAFLFSALTGLRWSDIIKLTWSEIQHDNKLGYRIRYQQKKTGKYETLPITETAVEILGNIGEGQQKVFKNLTYSAWNNLKLQKWVMKAGINKDITFHCARHTYATLLITNDVNMLTVSKMLGHSNLKTTQIYTKVLDLKKVEAANIFGKMNFLDRSDEQ